MFFVRISIHQRLRENTVEKPFHLKQGMLCHFVIPKQKGKKQQKGG
jgi:hypothetical protein